MAVHLTRIYTRTGDDGTTALGDMSRVRKTDPRVGAYADCDETNAALGVGTALHHPPLRVEESYVTRLETWCDEFNEGLAKLDSFILPGGTAGAALLHQARTLS